MQLVMNARLFSNQVNQMRQYYFLFINMFTYVRTGVVHVMALVL